ncbi:MAG: flagellar basal body-associated protein FliL [Proteobacteria bacterium]|nr:flagellar basal body-associated protein FliL [Pseudomonadota bacterium]
MADEATPAPEKQEAAAEGEQAKPAGEGAEGAVPEDAGKAKKKRMLMIVSGIVAVVGIVVAVGVVFFVGGGKHEDQVATSAPEVAMMDIPEFTVNLLGEEPSTQHFMKVKLALELGRKEDVAVVEKLLPRLQDDWNGFLRQLRPADLQGSAALFRVKEGLLRRASQSMEPATIKAVYVRELVVQ